MNRRLLRAASLVLCLSPSLALAQTPIRGAQLSVTVDSDRARRLGSMARQLERIGVPGYATLYRTTRQIVGANPTEGAMVFATVNGSKINSWYDTIGKHSIGFGTRCLPDKGVLGACIRVGNDWLYYETVRGVVNEKSGQKYGVESVTGKFDDRGLTADKVKSAVESTLMVSDAEMSAVRAFIMARHHQLFKHSASTTRDKGQIGQPIVPVWKKLGASGTFTNESCAQACLSFFNDSWLASFVENLPGIQAYGRAKGIPELAGASPRMVQTLQGLRARTGLGIPSGYKEIIKSSSVVADAVTVFNCIPADQRVEGAAVRYMQNPLQDLTWSVPGWANGLQSRSAPRCTVMLDRKPGQSPLRQTSTERVSLAQFLGNL